MPRTTESQEHVKITLVLRIEMLIIQGKTLAQKHQKGGELTHLLVKPSMYCMDMGCRLCAAYRYANRHCLTLLDHLVSCMRV